MGQGTGGSARTWDCSPKPDTAHRALGWPHTDPTATALDPEPAPKWQQCHTDPMEPRAIPMTGPTVPGAPQNSVLRQPPTLPSIRTPNPSSSSITPQERSGSGQLLWSNQQHHEGLRTKNTALAHPSSAKFIQHDPSAAGTELLGTQSLRDSTPYEI